MLKKVIMLSVSAVILIAIIIFSICVANNKSVKTSNQEENNKEKNTTVHITNMGLEKETDTTQEDSSETNQSDTSTEETENQQTVPTEPQTTQNDEQQHTLLQQNMKLDYIDPQKPMVALTFDDGPCRENTTRILDALKQINAHATFFVVGYNVDGNEDLIQRAAEEGNEIGNHTADHTKLTGIAPEAIDSLIVQPSERIKGLTNQQYVPLRPPYGAIDDNVMAMIQDPIILWSIDTLDWKTKNPVMTIENVQNSVYDGAIVLMHDMYQESADAAVELISWLNEQGYQLVTVSEMAYYRRGGLQCGFKYGSFQKQ